MTKDELKALVKQHFNLVEKSEKFDSATLEDGTKVTNDMDEAFEIGQMLYVITEEGEKVAAPEGDHVTESGIVLTVDAEGKIVDLKRPDIEGEGEGLAEHDEKEDMEVEEQLAKNKMQEEEAQDQEQAMEEMPKLEDIIEVIGEVVEEKMAEHKEDMKVKIEKMEEKIDEIKEKMSAFGAESAEEKTVPSTKFSAQKEKPLNLKRYNAMLNKLQINS